ncbi:MAG: TldD/PmbA family protein, partial [Deltaproteobacteria bacterium]|nr:TldD/PmbA family protein [Deltaproteobacteria bacterium]
GDGRRPIRREVVRDGVLKMFYLNTYYARKLDRPATTGGRSNWVVPTGPAPWQEVAAKWPRAILVTGFLGGNANPTTGDFSFGIRGRLVENGVPTKALSEMNMAGNLRELLLDLVALGNDPWVYGSTLAPSLVFGGVRFSGR